MAESVVYSTIDYIARLCKEVRIKATGFRVDPGKELESIFRYLEKNQEKEHDRSLLAEITRLAYQVEDAFDTYVYNTESSSAVYKMYWANRTSKALDILHKKIREANEKLQLESTGSQGSVSLGGAPSPPPLMINGHNCHLQADDGFVVGIEEDIDKLVNKLTADANDATDVWAIVGMGGSGKTTLARQVYNHPKVKSHFRYQAWISVSGGWDAYKLVSEISSQTRDNTGYADQFLDYVFSRPKKRLLVLDNVWDSETFEKDLLPIIMENYLLEETKIVITSRHQNNHGSSDAALKWCYHEMQLLREEDALDLLFNKVPKARMHRGLASDVVQNCRGLPLAIGAVGKLLKKKDTVEEWQTVVSQLVSKQGPNDLYPDVHHILALSYYNLRHYLKPCFLYFGLFPEDAAIKAETMLKMWVAEGFVRPQCEDGGRETLEVVARRLLQKLIDYTMIQVLKKTYCGKVKTLGVHDIMRNVCIKEGQKLDFLTVCSSQSDVTHMTSYRASINLSKCSTLPLENPQLRCILLYGDGGVSSKPALDLARVCEKFKSLRVLDINGINSFNGTMPKEIGDLIHLRYLRIRSTNIQVLPETIGKLRNLLTLDYWNVHINTNGIRLPNVLWKLGGLRHLYLPYEKFNLGDNFRLGEMKDLQILWGVRGGNWMLKEMPKLSSSNLRKLCIQGISSFEQMSAVLKSPVIRNPSNNLYSLALEWNNNCSFLGKGLSLEPLCCNNNVSLRKLRLKGNLTDKLTPLKFPSNLGKLELYYTQLKHADSMAALGELQCLKFLRLAKDSFAEKEWIVGKNAFPRLEELKLSKLPKLEKWVIGEEAMPCLRKLFIFSCTKLQRLPQRLEFIKTLERLNIEYMPHVFSSRLRRENSTSGEDVNLIQHIPNISIRFSTFWFKSLATKDSDTPSLQRM